MSIRNPPVTEGMFSGDYTKDQINLILQIREMEEVESLRHMIYDFPPEVVLEFLESGISIREILNDRGEDINNYVGRLESYQTTGVAFMYASPRSVLADSVGLGKTAEISGLINLLHSRKEITKFLMAVDNAALGQVHCELARFTGLNIVQLPSESKKMRKTITTTDWSKVDGVITKHSALRSDLLSHWLSLFLDKEGKSMIFNTFILDESSIVKNRDTKIFNYTNNICRIVDRVHFLNATTFERHILDIYNQIDMINDRLLPSKSRIEKQYCIFTTGQYWVKVDGKAQMKYKRDMMGYKNEEEFKQSLKLVYIGRNKKQAGKQTKAVYLVREVEPTLEQILAISKGYRYMEVLNAPSNIPELGIKMNKEEVPKIKATVDLIKNEFDKSKVMIYCFHLDAQEALKMELENEGYRVRILNGSIKSDVDRLKIIIDFNNGESDIIITNIKKSLNLYNGDVCIFYTVETNPARMEQIGGRIDRNVGDNLKTFVLLVYSKTEEYNFFMGITKQRSVDARNLILSAETIVDKFISTMEDGE